MRNNKILPKQKLSENSEAINFIKEMLFDEHPDVFLEDYIVEKAILHYYEFLKQKICALEPVNMFGLGKYTVVHKLSRKGHMQYYPKFTFSQHMILRLRDEQGTLTDAEKRTLEANRAFVQGFKDKKEARRQARLNEKLALKDVPPFLRTDINRFEGL
jgi:nucleoid DNA-binding protein